MSARFPRLVVIAASILFALANASSAVADDPNKAPCDLKRQKACHDACYQTYNNYIGGNPKPGQVHKHYIELTKCYAQCREQACGTVVPQPCELGKTKCGDRCVNLNINLKNCGACGSPCSAGQKCVSGLCK
jgi:hypothetical protein